MSSRIALGSFGTLLLGALAACSTVRESPSSSLAELGVRLAGTLCPGPPTQVESVQNLHNSGQTDRLETRQCAAGTSTLYVKKRGQVHLFLRSQHPAPTLKGPRCLVMSGWSKC